MIFQILSTKTSLKRIISLFVASTFIFSNVAFADISKTTNAPDNQKEPQAVTDPAKIVISRDYGLIKSKFTGKDNKKLIVHIQDAHCNYEAQTNITKILEGLIKNDGLKLVSVEGADGFIDTSWFKAFPDADIRKEVADYFMKKGEITGPEFLSITTDYPIKLFGAETRSYYIENLNAFTSSYPLKEDTEKYFNQIKVILSKLKTTIYSEELKTLDAKIQDYESKKLQFADYVKVLEALAVEHKINLRPYESLFKLISVFVYEKKINFNIVDKERGVLIDEITKKLTKEALTELVTQSLSFKTGKISSAEYYEYLKKLALHHGFQLSTDYPNLFNYIIYNSVYSRIENEKLFNDIKKLEIAIKEKLFANDDQRTLEKLSRHIDILLGLTNIKLLNGDFDYYKEHKEEFIHEAFAGFIKRIASKYGFAFELDTPSDAVKESMPKLEDFYSIAIKRDRALVDNTLQAMKKENAQISVLVTGGFHSEGIAKMLESQGISYIVVCPNITKDVETPYIKILTNQRTPLEDILTDATVEPKAKDGSMLAPMLLTLAANLSEAQLKNLSAAVDIAIPGADLKGRINDDLGGWINLHVAKWIGKTLRNIRQHKYAADIDVLKQAYRLAMENALKNARGSDKLTAADKRFINDVIMTSAVFRNAFKSAFERMSPRVALESVANATGRTNAAKQSLPKAKTSGSALSHSRINEAVEKAMNGKEGEDYLVIMDNGTVPDHIRNDPKYKRYADLIDRLKEALRTLKEGDGKESDIFKDIILNSPEIDAERGSYLERVFTRENLLKLLEPGSGIRMVLIQPKNEQVPDMRVPWIVEGDSEGWNYGHYGVGKKSMYLPWGAIDIFCDIAESDNAGEAEKDQAKKNSIGIPAHELAEYLVLTQAYDGDTSLEKIDVANAANASHFAAQHLEVAITGRSPLGAINKPLGVESQLDYALDELTASYNEQLAYHIGAGDRHKIMGHQYKTGSLRTPVYPIKAMFRMNDMGLDLRKITDERRRELLTKAIDYFIDAQRTNKKISISIVAGGEASRMAKGVDWPEILLSAQRDEPQRFGDPEKHDESIPQAKALLPAGKVNGRWVTFLEFHLVNVSRMNDIFEGLGLGRPFVPKIMDNDRYDQSFRAAMKESQKRYPSLKKDENLIFPQPLGWRATANESSVRRSERDFMSEGAMAYELAVAQARARAGDVLYQLGGTAEGHGEYYHSQIIPLKSYRGKTMFEISNERNIEYDWCHNLDNMAMVDEDWLILFGYMLEKQYLVMLEASRRPKGSAGKGGGFVFDNDYRPMQMEDDVYEASITAYGFNRGADEAMRNTGEDNNSSPVNNGTIFTKIRETMRATYGDELYDALRNSNLAEKEKALAELAQKGRTRFGIAPTCKIIRKMPDGTIISPMGTIIFETRAWDIQQAVKGRVGVVGTYSTVDVEKQMDDQSIFREKDAIKSLNIIYNVRFAPLKEKAHYTDAVLQGTREVLTEKAIAGDLVSESFMHLVKNRLSERRFPDTNSTRDERASASGAGQDYFANDDVISQDWVAYHGNDNIRVNPKTGEVARRAADGTFVRIIDLPKSESSVRNGIDNVCKALESVTGEAGKPVYSKLYSNLPRNSVLESGGKIVYLFEGADPVWIAPYKGAKGETKLAVFNLYTQQLLKSEINITSGRRILVWEVEGAKLQAGNVDINLISLLATEYFSGGQQVNWNDWKYVTNSRNELISRTTRGLTAKRNTDRNSLNFGTFDIVGGGLSSRTSASGIEGLLQNAENGNEEACGKIETMPINTLVTYFEKNIERTVKNLPATLFGTGKAYDARGYVLPSTDKDGNLIPASLTPENVYVIGKMLGTFYSKEGGLNLLTGDMRLDTPILRYVLALGYASVGANVEYAPDIISTGAHNLLTTENPNGKYTTVVQVSGSHNPPGQNGVKMKVDFGKGKIEPLYAQDLRNMYDRLMELSKKGESLRKPAKIGSVTRLKEGELENFVINMLNETLPAVVKDEIVVIDARAGATGNIIKGLIRKRGFTIVDMDDIVDMGNGELVMAETQKKDLLSRIGDAWKAGRENERRIAILLNIRPDGSMKRGIWDPAKEKAREATAALVNLINSNLSKEMPQAFGVVFDGDGDRITTILENGKDVETLAMYLAYYQRFLLDEANQNVLIRLAKSGFKEPVKVTCDVRANSVLLNLIKNINSYLQVKAGITDRDIIKGFYIQTGYPPQLDFVTTRVGELEAFIKETPSLSKDVNFMRDFQHFKETFFTAEASGHNFFHTSKTYPERVCDDAIAGFIVLMHIKETIGSFEAPALNIKGTRTQGYTLSDLYNGFPVSVSSREVDVGISPQQFANKNELVAALGEGMKKVFKGELKADQPLIEEGNYGIQSVEGGVIMVAGYKIQLKDGRTALIRASETSQKLTTIFEGFDLPSLIGIMKTIRGLLAEKGISVNNLAAMDAEIKRLETIFEKNNSIVVGKNLHTPLYARGDADMAKRFLKGGYKQDGYGVEEGAVIDGSFAVEGNQGYYATGGKEVFISTVNSMREHIAKRESILGKPIKYVIKPGIGGQHTPFQGIADSFEVIDIKTGKVVGEYELGKDYESALSAVLKELDAGWDQIMVIPSSKSGSTDETMMIFVELMSVLIKNVTPIYYNRIDGEKLAAVFLNTLHEVNFIDGNERPGKDLFKVDKERFGTDSLIELIYQRARRENISAGKDAVRKILGVVLGNMFFETTDRPEASRLSAFIRNSGLDKELGEDAPGFGAMFDNVGGRWTADLHMMTFLAYHHLDVESYWNTRYEGIKKVRDGKHAAVDLGNRILDEGITDIALVVPDELLWFGKAMEQNFNESIWQNGFANLIAVKQSMWDSQKEHYSGKPGRLVINISDLDIQRSSGFNVANPANIRPKDLGKQQLANALGELFTTFYGMTHTVGNRLIARALAIKGFTPADVDINDLDNPATKIVQENLYLRQPYVELGKGLLEAKLNGLQQKEREAPGAIEAELARIKKAAEDRGIESNIPELSLPAKINNITELSETIKNAMQYAGQNNRKLVPFVYLEGGKFYGLRDYLTSLGVEWVMQGTGDQHISYQQVLAQPQKYLPFIVSFVPEKTLPGRPAIGFAKGYLDNVSPNMVRDAFAEASYKALTDLRKEEGGRGVFMRMKDSMPEIDMLKEAFTKSVTQVKEEAKVTPIAKAEIPAVKQPREVRESASGEEKQPAEEAIVWTEFINPLSAEEIDVNVTAPNIADLESTLSVIALNKEAFAKDGKVVIVSDTGISDAVTPDVYQKTAKLVSKYLDDAVIHVRGKGAELPALVESAIKGEKIRAIVTMAGDGTLNAKTADGRNVMDALSALHDKSRILDIQSKDSDGNRLFIQVPALYNLALSIGYEMPNEKIMQCLQSIGIVIDANGNPIDPMIILTEKLVRILPRIRPVDMDADTRAQTLARKALERSL
mgnify:CR=1 FL=1